MGKASHQNQPYTEARRKGFSYHVEGTANVIRSLVESNMDRWVIKEIHGTNIASYDQQQRVIRARNHLVKAYKELAILSKELRE